MNIGWIRLATRLLLAAAVAAAVLLLVPLLDVDVADVRDESAGRVVAAVGTTGVTGAPSRDVISTWLQEDNAAPHVDVDDNGGTDGDVDDNGGTDGDVDVDGDVDDNGGTDVDPPADAVVPRLSGNGVPCANDYDEGADVEPEATVELVVLLSAPSPRMSLVCPTLETAVRLGYNVTLVTSVMERWRARGNHEKVRLTDLFLRLRRAEILQQLGLLDRGLHLNITSLAARVPADAHAAAVRAHLDARPPHLFVTADAFDVLAQLPPRAILRRWRAHWPRTSRFVISGEMHLYPDAVYTVYPNVSASVRDPRDGSEALRFPYPNSGVWLGQLDAVAELYAHVLKLSRSNPPQCVSTPRSDQCIVLLTMALRNMTGPEYVDMHARISQAVTPYGAFDPARDLALCADGRVRRTDVDRTPVFVHHNGRAKSLNTALPVSSAYLKQRGWHRRALDGGRTRPANRFDIAHDVLERHLRMYDDAMEPVPDAAKRIAELCLK